MSDFLIQAIGAVLTIGLTMGLTATLNRSAARTETRIDANRNVLRVNVLYAWLGWISCLIAVAFTIGSYHDPDPALYVLTPLMWLLFGGMGLTMLLNYYRHRVSWDTDYLYIMPWLGSEKILCWTEIEEVRYVEKFSLLKFRSRGKWQSISTNLVGLKALVEALEKRTKISPGNLGLPF